ncbi:MAG: hypothetical protein IT285_02945 [Bdellovibrionales bacterium]|nr:hypothetical protein [Bdellovibrionales bacterium]
MAYGLFVFVMGVAFLNGTVASAAEQGVEPLNCPPGETICQTLNSQLPAINQGVDFSGEVRAPLPCAPDGVCSPLRACSEVVADVVKSIENQASEQICLTYSTVNNGICNFLEKDVHPRNTHCSGGPYTYFRVEGSPDVDFSDRSNAFIRGLRPQAYKKATEIVLNEIRTQKSLRLSASSGAQPLGGPYLKQLYRHLKRSSSETHQTTLRKVCAETGTGAGKICAQTAELGKELSSKVHQLDCRNVQLRNQAEYVFAMMAMTRITEEFRDVYSRIQAQIEPKVRQYTSAMESYVDGQDCWSKGCGERAVNRYYRRDQHVINYVIRPLYESPDIVTPGSFLLPTGPSCGAGAMPADSAGGGTGAEGTTQNGPPSMPGGASGELFGLLGGFLGIARRKRAAIRSKKGRKWKASDVALFFVLVFVLNATKGCDCECTDVPAASSGVECPDGSAAQSQAQCPPVDPGGPGPAPGSPPAERGRAGLEGMQAANTEADAIDSDSSPSDGSANSEAATADLGGGGDNVADSGKKDETGGSGGGLPSGGGGKGAGRGGGGGGSGMSLGTGSTGPSVVDSDALSGSAAGGDQSAATYAGGGGSGRKGGKGGAGNDPMAAFRAGFGGGKGGSADGKTESLEFGATAGDGVDPMASEDPEDYFGRIQSWESIFKIVERRYKSKSQGWALTDSKVR